MVKISGNMVQLDKPATEIKVFVHKHEVNVVGVTVDKLNRVYIALEIKE